MNEQKIYEGDKDDPDEFDSRVITRLVRNYRSHEGILVFLNVEVARRCSCSNETHNSKIAFSCRTHDVADIKCQL